MHFPDKMAAILVGSTCWRGSRACCETLCGPEPPKGVELAVEEEVAMAEVKLDEMLLGRVREDAARAEKRLKRPQGYAKETPLVFARSMAAVPPALPLGKRLEALDEGDELEEERRHLADLQAELEKFGEELELLEPEGSAFQLIEELVTPRPDGSSTDSSLEASTGMNSAGGSSASTAVCHCATAGAVGPPVVPLALNVSRLPLGPVPGGNATPSGCAASAWAHCGGAALEELPAPVDEAGMLPQDSTPRSQGSSPVHFGLEQECSSGGGGCPGPPPPGDVPLPAMAASGSLAGAAPSLWRALPAPGDAPGCRSRAPPLSVQRCRPCSAGMVRAATASCEEGLRACAAGLRRRVRRRVL